MISFVEFVVFEATHTFLKQYSTNYDRRSIRFRVSGHKGDIVYSFDFDQQRHYTRPRSTVAALLRFREHIEHLYTNTKPYEIRLRRRYFV